MHQLKSSASCPASARWKDRDRLKGVCDFQSYGFVSSFVINKTAQSTSKLFIFCWYGSDYMIFLEVHTLTYALLIHNIEIVCILYCYAWIIFMGC